MKRCYNHCLSTGKVIAAVVLVVVLTGCTQQLAKRSQTQWLDKSESETLYTATLDASTASMGGAIKTTLAGYLESAAIGELSGLAPSHKNSEIFWAINDSGNLAELFAMDNTGRHIQTFTLPESNVDWEDLSSFEQDGQSWLVIADTGDNFRRRGTSTLYVLEEPDVHVRKEKDRLQASGVLPNTAVTVHSRIDFSYEDGPQNVESIAVSSEESVIYLVAKDGARSSVYQLPLNLEQDTSEQADNNLVASRVGNTQGLSWDENDRWLERKLGSRLLLGPTAMDISADNKLAVIANYRHLYLYRKSASQTWSEALRSTPEIISSHRMAQSESVAFSQDGKYIIVSSEGRHAPVLLVR